VTLSPALGALSGPIHQRHVAFSDNVGPALVRFAVRCAAHVVPHYWWEKPTYGSFVVAVDTLEPGVEVR